MAEDAGDWGKLGQEVMVLVVKVLANPDIFSRLLRTFITFHLNLSKLTVNYFERRRWTGRPRLWYRATAPLKIGSATCALFGNCLLLLPFESRLCALYLQRI